MTTDDERMIIDQDHEIARLEFTIEYLYECLEQPLRDTFLRLAGEAWIQAQGTRADNEADLEADSLQDKARLPIAYDHCDCQCHIMEGVMHFVACCGQ